MNEPKSLIARAEVLEDTADRLAITNPVFHHSLIRELRTTARELRATAKKEAA